ncbi:hypothetical protein RCL_jg777.t1 [Rhizophagus clarus]|uniref:Reverse transcriptase domain-containing protein n=1 Tax=Rhizophagus clarus TaxID=94130 RepID=A0A8H3QK21_9GLOM|nr:hypothetical protein RCL_jg777.t1 [Rhizophagus clarus]
MKKQRKFQTHMGKDNPGRRGARKEYKVLRGIDQGEVISPLLWIIYYDPIFARINATPGLQYYLPDNFITYNTCVQSYLDDTTWITSSLEKMEQLLLLSNEFYEMVGQHQKLPQQVLVITL